MFSKLITASLAVSFLAGGFFLFAGMGDRMPPREPVVLGPREIGVREWPSRDPAGLAALWEATARGERPLRIASYNVHKCTGMDFRKDPGRVAEVIRSLDADIISLQEVLSGPGGGASAQVRYLAERAGMYMAVSAPTRLKKEGEYGNALLSRFPITRVRLHDISLGGFEPRGVIDADIMVGDFTVRVLATHFGLWPMERNRQMERLLQILPERPRFPLVVMGDMNGWVPGSPVLKRLEERLGKPVTMRSFPALIPFLPLDRIWVLPSEYLTGAFSISNPADRSGFIRFASDHLPVVAAFYLRAKAVSGTLLPAH